MSRGGKRDGAGRPKGSQNKVTKKIKDAVAELAEANVGRVQEWLDEVAENDPAKAIDLLTKLLEYTVPKRARTDLHGSLETKSRLIING